MFVLNEVIEREISTPVFFPTMAAAEEAFIQRACQALGYTEDEIREAIASENTDIIECNLNNMTFWSTRYGNNFDWKIEEVFFCEKDFADKKDSIV